MKAFIRSQGRRVLAMSLCGALYTAARLPELSPDERETLGGHFRFDATTLPTVAPPSSRHVRAVHPQFRQINTWISSVGAAVALNDLDGDGLPNDICYVDVRSDQVIVAPAPGTGDRFASFVVDPSPLPFDTATMAPMGCLPADLNEDGRLDLLVYYWGRAPIAFLSRAAAPGPVRLDRDSYVASEVVAHASRWFTNAATFADMDGDGHGDVVIGNYFPDGANVLDAQGTEDEQMQHSMSRAANGGRKHILRWLGGTGGAHPTVRFADDTRMFADSVLRGWTLALGAADLDGDLLPELYIANDFGPDRLLRNRSTPGHFRFELLHGQWSPALPKSRRLGHDSFKGMGVDFADLNGDGRLDIAVSNIAEEFALEESHFVFVSEGSTSLMEQGIAPYVDRGETLGMSRGGWGWDCRFGDFDNRGAVQLVRATGFARGEVNRWPELQELAMGNDELLANPRVWPAFGPGTDLSGSSRLLFFARARDGRFYDVAPEAGLGQPQISRGIATADVDGDGRLDFAVANQWEDSRFYHNVSANAGSFVGLRLRLADSGTAPVRLRPAITAEARVCVSPGRCQSAQVDGGNGHSGKRSSDLHFGLGAWARGDSLRVAIRWRDASGTPRSATIRTIPGWHVVELGASSGEARVR